MNWLLFDCETNGVLVVTGDHGSYASLISPGFHVFDARQALEQSLLVHGRRRFVGGVDRILVA
jgi:metallophosphoesterase superfamily enzyme